MREPGIEARCGARWWADKLRDGFRLENDGGLPPYAMAMSLSVDYHPSPVLHDALLAADLPTGLGVLPFKTTMWVEPGCVKVGDGYGAEPVEVPLAG